MSDRFDRAALDRLAEERRRSRNQAAKERQQADGSPTSPAVLEEEAQRTNEVYEFCKSACRGFRLESGHEVQVGKAHESHLLGVPKEGGSFVALRVEHAGDPQLQRPITLTLLRFRRGKYQMVTVGSQWREFGTFDALKEAVFSFLADLDKNQMEYLLWKARLRSSRYGSRG